MIKNHEAVSKIRFWFIFAAVPSFKPEEYFSN
jgi:hypothetical protein